MINERLKKLFKNHIRDLQLNDTNLGFKLFICKCDFYFQKKTHILLVIDDVINPLMTDPFQSDRCYKALLLSHFSPFFYYYSFKRTFQRFCSLSSEFKGRNDRNYERNDILWIQSSVSKLLNYYFSAMLKRFTETPKVHGPLKDL